MVGIVIIIVIIVIIIIIVVIIVALFVKSTHPCTCSNFVHACQQFQRLVAQPAIVSIIEGSKQLPPLERHVRHGTLKHLIITATLQLCKSRCLRVLENLKI